MDQHSNHYKRMKFVGIIGYPFQMDQQVIIVFIDINSIINSINSNYFIFVINSIINFKSIIIIVGVIQTIDSITIINSIIAINPITIINSILIDL